MNPSFSGVPRVATKEEIQQHFALAQKKRQEELQSVFLLGIATGAVCVGSFFLIRWIFSKPEMKEVVEEVLEETMNA